MGSNPTAPTTCTLCEGFRDGDRFEMRIGGLVLIAVGILSILARGATIVLLMARGAADGHALSKAFGGLGFGALFLIAGLALLRRSRGTS